MLSQNYRGAAGLIAEDHPHSRASAKKMVPERDIGAKK